MIVPVILCAAVASTTPLTTDRPVRAVVERSGSSVRVRVIGLSDTPQRVRYTLRMRSGGNDATQSGTAWLKPGVPQTLLDLTQSLNDAPASGELLVIGGTIRYEQKLDL